MRTIDQKISAPFSIRKGAYGFIISKKGCEKVLENVSEIKITCGGFDTLLGLLTMRKILTTYHFLPSICHVDFSFSSNIYNSSNRLKEIHNSESHEH